MQEWKVRQEIYHRLNPVHDDDLSNFDITISADVFGDAIRYFTMTELGWVYPAKSYVVAICYAHWISQVFGDNFYVTLDDQDLLFGNDPYFVPYSADKETYDKIIRALDGEIDETMGIVPDVRKYFNEEFGL